MPTSHSRETRTKDSPIGVFGFGNPMRGDDGIVSSVFESISEGDADSKAQLIEFGSRSFRVVHALREFDRVLIVDAMEFGGDPGEVRVCRPNEISASSNGSGVHGMDLLQIIELSMDLPNGPDSAKLFGIQPESMPVRSELSASMADRLPEIRARLERVIETFDVED